MGVTWGQLTAQGLMYKYGARGCTWGLSDPPKKKMEAFVRRFPRVPTAVITHQLLAAQWNGQPNLSIPLDRYEEFWGHYVSYILRRMDGLNVFNERLVRGEPFRFFVDLDFSMECFSDGSLPTNERDMIEFTDAILGVLNDAVKEVYQLDEVEVMRAVRIWGKFHFIYPSIITRIPKARLARASFLRATESHPILNRLSLETWYKAFDPSPYSSGLRMLWSHKGRMGNAASTRRNRVIYESHFGFGKYQDVYHPVDAEWKILPPSVELLRMYSIHNLDNVVIENDDVVAAAQPDFNGLNMPAINNWCQGACRILGMGIDGRVQRVDTVNPSTIRLTLPPQACPFTGFEEGKFNADNVRMHRRTAERNVACHYILVSSHGAIFKCFNDECATSSLSLFTAPDEINSYLETVDRWYWVVRALTCHHEDVARFVFHEVKDYLRVIKRSSGYKWFVFDKHRWIEQERIFIIMMQDENIPSLFTKFLIDHDPQTYGSEHTKELIKKVNVLRDNLKNRPFVVNVSALVGTKLETMYPDFGDLLNSKSNLLVFKNGVLDFREGLVLRDGRPDDYCSLTTNHDYIPWEQYALSIRNDIQNYLSRVLTRPGVLEYFLWLLASSLFGALQRQDMHFLQGKRDR